MRDLQNMPDDFKRKQAQLNKLAKSIPKYIAGAAEKMKDANFSAQGFVSNGATAKWPKRVVIRFHFSNFVRAKTVHHRQICEVLRITTRIRIENPNCFPREDPANRRDSSSFQNNSNC